MPSGPFGPQQRPGAAHPAIKHAKTILLHFWLIFAMPTRLVAHRTMKHARGALFPLTRSGRRGRQTSKGKMVNPFAEPLPRTWHKGMGGTYAWRAARA